MEENMKSMIKVIIFLAIILLFSGCQTVTLRSSSDAFRTGRVLPEGEYRVATNTLLILTAPMPGVIWRVSGGLPFDMEATVGWGVHGLIIAPESEGDSGDDFYHGPEIFLTKNLLNIEDSLYLSATLGSEVNVTPSFDATIMGGLNFGFYPIDWFVLFGHAQALYHTQGYFAPQVGLGLGFDGPLVLKIAAYTHFKENSIELHDGTYFWPFYYGIQLGLTF